MAQFHATYLKDYIWQAKVRKVLLWIAAIAVTVAIAFCCAFFFCQRVVITESSMEPTLSAGDKVLVNTAAYAIGKPQRGDIIVFRTGNDKNSTLSIKRVIGLPGETVEIRDGQILINGETYVEKKDLPPIINPGQASMPITLGGTEYFVLGDNRNDSEDSRHLNIGAVEKSQIVGKLWLRVTSFERFGRI